MIKPHLKRVALITLCCFIFSPLTWGAEYFDLRSLSDTHEPYPPLLNSKQTEWVRNIPGPKIVHIRDAHESISAQQSIKAILDELSRYHPIDFVGLEGSSGIIDYSLLQAFPSTRVRKKTAERLMRSGEISGAEFYGITQNPNAVFYGIENQQAYTTNLHEFQTLFAGEPSALAVCIQWETQIKKLGARLFPQPVQKLIKDASWKSEDPLSFITLWHQIKPMIEQIHGNLDAFPGLKIMDRALAAEAHSFLHPNQDQHSLSLLKQVSVEKLSDELEDCIQSLIQAHLTSLESRKLWETHNRLRLIKELVSGSLSWKHYQHFNKSPEFHDASKLRADIRKLLQSQGFSSSLASEEKLQEQIIRSISFYDHAHQRSSIMVQNMLDQMHAHGAQTGALIAGGFHSEAISTEISRTRVPQTTILPLITHTENRPYLETILQKEAYQGQALREEKLLNAVSLMLGLSVLAGYDLHAVKQSYLRRYEKEISSQNPLVSRSNHPSKNTTETFASVSNKQTSFGNQTLATGSIFQGPPLSLQRLQFFVSRIKVLEANPGDKSLLLSSPQGMMEITQDPAEIRPVHLSPSELASLLKKSRSELRSSVWNSKIWKPWLIQMLIGLASFQLISSPAQETAAPADNPASEKSPAASQEISSLKTSGTTAPAEIRKGSSSYLIQSQMIESVLEALDPEKTPKESLFVRLFAMRALHAWFDGNGSKGALIEGGTCPFCNDPALRGKFARLAKEAGLAEPEFYELKTDPLKILRDEKSSLDDKSKAFSNLAAKKDPRAKGLAWRWIKIYDGAAFEKRNQSESLLRKRAAIYLSVVDHSWWGTQNLLDGVRTEQDPIVKALMIYALGEKEVLGEKARQLLRRKSESVLRKVLDEEKEYYVLLEAVQYAAKNPSDTFIEPLLDILDQEPPAVTEKNASLAPVQYLQGPDGALVSEYLTLKEKTRHAVLQVVKSLPSLESTVINAVERRLDGSALIGKRRTQPENWPGPYAQYATLLLELYGRDAARLKESVHDLLNMKGLSFPELPQTILSQSVTEQLHDNSLRVQRELRNKNEVLFDRFMTSASSSQIDTPQLVLSLLKDPQAAYRALAAQTLGQANALEAEPALILALKDRSPLVQAFVLQALMTIERQKMETGLSVFYPNSDSSLRNQLKDMKNLPEQNKLIHELISGLLSLLDGSSTDLDLQTAAPESEKLADDKQVSSSLSAPALPAKQALAAIQDASKSIQILISLAANHPSQEKDYEALLSFQTERVKQLLQDQSSIRIELEKTIISSMMEMQLSSERARWIFFVFERLESAGVKTPPLLESMRPFFLKKTPPDPQVIERGEKDFPPSDSEKTPRPVTKPGPIQRGDVPSLEKSQFAEDAASLPEPRIKQIVQELVRGTVQGVPIKDENTQKHIANLRTMLNLHSDRQDTLQQIVRDEMLNYPLTPDHKSHQMALFNHLVDQGIAKPADAALLRKKWPLLFNLNSKTNTVAPGAAPSLLAPSSAHSLMNEPICGPSGCITNLLLQKTQEEKKKQPSNKNHTPDKKESSKISDPGLLFLSPKTAMALTNTWREGLQALEPLDGRNYLSARKSLRLRIIQNLFAFNSDAPLTVRQVLDVFQSFHGDLAPEELPTYAQIYGDLEKLRAQEQLRRLDRTGRSYPYVLVAQLTSPVTRSELRYLDNALEPFRKTLPGVEIELAQPHDAVSMNQQTFIVPIDVASSPLSVEKRNRILEQLTWAQLRNHNFNSLPPQGQDRSAQALVRDMLTKFPSLNQSEMLMKILPEMAPSDIRLWTILTSDFSRGESQFPLQILRSPKTAIHFAITPDIVRLDAAFQLQLKLLRAAGTQVTIGLMLNQSKEAPSQELNRLRAEGFLRNERVQIMDLSDTNRIHLKKMLASSGQNQQAPVYLLSYETELPPLGLDENISVIRLTRKVMSAWLLFEAIRNGRRGDTTYLVPQAINWVKMRHELTVLQSLQESA